MVTAGILPFRENSHGRTGNRMSDIFTYPNPRVALHNLKKKMFELDVFYGCKHDGIPKCAQYLVTQMLI